MVSLKRYKYSSEFNVVEKITDKFSYQENLELSENGENVKY